MWLIIGNEVNVGLLVVFYYKKVGLIKVFVFLINKVFEWYAYRFYYIVVIWYWINFEFVLKKGCFIWVVDVFVFGWCAKR